MSERARKKENTHLIVSVLASAIFTPNCAMSSFVAKCCFSDTNLLSIIFSTSSINDFASSSFVN